MFKADEYITSLIKLLKATFAERLLYVGLQGSYLRDEANEDSDIDIMVVINDLSVADLTEYKKAIYSLDGYEKSCGFICGFEELKKWNPLEICHLTHTTKDYFGELAELVPKYCEKDVRYFIKSSLGNLYHELCHRYIHSSKENNIAKLSISYRSVFFILQNLYFLEKGEFIGTKNELLKVLTGKDRLVLDTAISLNNGNEFDFDKAFDLLFTWCKGTMIRA